MTDNEFFLYWIFMTHVFPNVQLCTWYTGMPLPGHLHGFPNPVASMCHYNNQGQVWWYMDIFWASLAQTFFMMVLPMTIRGDNEGSIAMTKNPQFHKQSKHIGLQYHSIREQVHKGEIIVKNCRTQNQTADVLTKPLPRAKHRQHTAEMGLALAWRGVLEYGLVDHARLHPRCTILSNYFTPRSDTNKGDRDTGIESPPWPDPPAPSVIVKRLWALRPKGPRNTNIIFLV